MMLAAVAALIVVAGSSAAWAASNCPSSPSYSPDFPNQACLELNGNASLQGTFLQITPAATGQDGSAWYVNPQAVAGSFSSTFTFQLTGGSADGFAFLIQNSPAGIHATGPGGCAMGFADDPLAGNNYFCGGSSGGIPNSLAIGFKTFNGDGTEYPPANSVFIASNGTGANCENVPNAEGQGSPGCVIATNDLTSITLADGNVHTVTITYALQPTATESACYAPASNAPEPCLDVILDGTDLFPTGVPFNMSSIGLNNGSAYAGFTSSTGAAFENSDILSWTFTPQSFGNVNVCPSGSTNPAPCSNTIPVTFNVPAGTTINSVNVLTQGLSGLDFSLADPGTCTGTYTTAGVCTASVTFTPQAPGLRQGAVELLTSAIVPLIRPLFGSSATPWATAPIYGIGQGPAIAFGPGSQTTVAGGMNAPRAVALDAAGDIFVAQNLSNQVVEIPAGGGAQTTVGSNLSGPYGVAVDGAGNVFIADTGNNQVVEVPAGGGAQTTVASGLNFPLGVTVDGGGDLFIADTDNNQVLELPAGGGPEQIVASGINNPNTVVVDTRGDLFIVDSNDTLLEIPAGCTSSGCQTTVGTKLNNPRGATVDAAGDLFIADTFDSLVTEIPAGCMSVNCQITVGSGFGYPWGLAVDGAGDIFITDTNDGQLNEVNRSQPPSLSFAATTVGGASSDSPQTVTVQNVGNTTLNLSAIAFPTDFPQVGDENDCTTSTPLTPGLTCPLTIEFKPTTGGLPPTGTLLSETVSLTDNALNATNATQAISVAGDGLAAQVSVPNLSGQTQTGASNLLIGVGLTLGTVTTQSSTVPIGEVVSQIPAAGASAQVGSPVTVILSSGVSVPGVVGFTEGAASTAITSAGLVLAQPVTTQYSDTVPSDTVISQNPAVSSVVNGGTQVSLVVSGGQPPAADQLSLENNYFVTGDYATAGVSLSATGSGSIMMPDPSPCVGTGCGPGVPDGADIRVAYLYWATIENTSAPSGMNGTFLGYPITGLQVGVDQPNYSDGTYTGTLRVYRADVNTYLPLLANSTVGVRVGSGLFPVSLPNGGGALPITEGASLVEIYRVLSKDFPLKSVVLYNGSVVANSSTGPIPQAMVGFYDATGGASGTGEVTNLFTANGSWSDSESSETLGQPDEYIDTLNLGNAYAAAIVSTQVNNTDDDGILDAWKTAQGYTDVKTGSWVPLTGAVAGHHDLFVQFDYMCSALLQDGVSCDFNQPNLYPSPDAQGNDPLAMVTQAFLNSGVYLHLKPGNAIPESQYTCTDNGSALCEFPSTQSAPQPGVVAWNGGVELSKIWPANFNACESNPTVANCQTRFPLSQKDSYHYVMFAYSLALPAWNSWFGSLTNINVNGATTTLITNGLGSTCPSRITISGVLGNPSLNGVYGNVTCDPGLTTMTIATPSGSPTSWMYPNNTLPEPAIGVTSGTVTTISGYSDLGGSDSVVSLGAWAQDPNQDMSKPATVIAGTMFHEIGHTLGLAHGGLYYDTQGSYIPTYEANCKPNYQSSMNYLFQLDGVGSTGTVTYSSQNLEDQNKNPLSFASLGNVTKLIDASGMQPLILSSSWYVPFIPGTTPGSAATMHCDGTPLKDAGDLAIRVNGTIDPLSPTWSDMENIAFDGPAYSTLRGYSDMANLDLRQVAATSNEFSSLASLTQYSGAGVTIGGAGGRGVTIGGAGGVTIGGAGGVTIGGAGGVTIGGAGGVTIGGAGGVTIGGAGGVTIGGAGGAEMDYLTANSVVRPPSSPGMTPTPQGVPPGVIITWNAPAFGAVETYTIYRSVNGAPAVAIGSVSGVNGTPPGTTWTDFNPQSGTVVYTITTTLFPVPVDMTSRESQPSVPAVMKSAQTIDLTLPVSVPLSSSTTTISAIAETNGAANNLQVNFAATGACSVASQSLTSGTSFAVLNLNSTGTCNITASQSGSSTFDAASPVTGSFQITSSGQSTNTPTITLSSLPGVQYGSGFSVNAMSTSGAGVTFTASGPCTVGSGPTTAMGTTTGAGKCTITASAAANGNYGPATTSQSFTIYQAVLDVTAVSPTVLYGLPIPSLTPAVLGTNYTLSGFIGNDGASSVNGIPALSTNAMQGNDPGSYPIIVSTGSLASTNYSFLYLNGNVIIQQATPTIRILNLPASGIYGGGFTATYSYSGNGTPTESVTSTTPAVCTASGSSVNYVGVGTCTLVANATQTTDYAAATGTAQSFQVNQATATISVANLPANGVYGGGFTATYIYSGNGTPTESVTSSTPAVCTASGSFMNYVGVGTCTLVANATQTTDYAAATGTSQSFQVNQATATVSVKDLPAGGTYGGGFTATYTYSGTGTPTESVTSNSPSVCTASSNSVSYVGVGTCTVVAHAGVTTDDLAATGTTQSFQVNPATATISISNIPALALDGSGFIPAFSYSGNGTPAKSVTSTTTSVCAVSGTSVNFIGFGTCTLTAGAAATTDYLAAAGSPQSFTVDLITSINSANNTTFTVGTAGTFTVTTAAYPVPSITETGALPNGVTFIDNHNGTGTLSGKPTISGIYPITFTAQNGVGSPATQSFTLTSETTVPASGTTCNGVYIGTFSGNVTVSSGQNCIFLKGGITGNITETGGNIAFSNATISGNIQVSGGTYAIGPSTTVKSNVTVQSVPTGTAQNLICGTSISGNLVLQNDGTAATIGSGTASCAANTVSGSVTVQANKAAITLDGDIIKGSLVDQSNTASTTMSGNTVSGSVTDQSNTAPSTISLNAITGTLVVQSNSGTSLLSQNTVGSSLTDQGNTGATQVTGNKVTGVLLCQSNTSITGSGDTASKLEGQCATF